VSTNFAFHNECLVFKTNTYLGVREGKEILLKMYYEIRNTKFGCGLKSKQVNSANEVSTEYCAMKRE